MIFAGETEVLGENLPSTTLSTTNPTWIDPGLRGERPATNRLSHGTAASGFSCQIFLTGSNYLNMNVHAQSVELFLSSEPVPTSIL
jgi:hypothetical protein